MRLIDADSLAAEITAMINEYEHRIPVWSPNDMLTSGRDTALKYGYKADGVEAALHILRRMPTINAKPETTVWMRGRNKDGQDGIYCCECGYFVPLFYEYYYDVNDLKNDYMYCPHCGRKVENDNEEA